MCLAQIMFSTATSVYPTWDSRRKHDDEQSQSSAFLYFRGLLLERSCALSTQALNHQPAFLIHPT